MLYEFDTMCLYPLTPTLGQAMTTANIKTLSNERLVAYTREIATIWNSMEGDTTSLCAILDLLEAEVEARGMSMATICKNC